METSDLMWIKPIYDCMMIVRSFESNDAVLKENVSWRKTWHLKRGLKRLCHCKWKAWYIFIIHQLFYIWEGNKILPCSQGSNTLWKGANWKFIFLWRKINWYGLQIAKRHFNYTIWLISEKSIVVYTFLHHGDMCMYQQFRQTRLTEKIVD